MSKTFSLNQEKHREGSITPSQRTGDGESQYSRSVSHSVIDDRYSKAEFSDAETNNDDNDETVASGGSVQQKMGAENEHFKSFNATKAAGSFCRKLAAPKEFGGWKGVSLLMLLIPVLVIYLQWCCQPGHCKFRVSKDILAYLGKRQWLRDLFNMESVAAYLYYNFAIFLLSYILFGRSVRLADSLEYKFNLLQITVFTVLAYSVAVYLKYPITDFILNNYMRFNVFALLNAYVVALWAYMRSDMLKQKDTKAQCNVYAKTGNFLVDYALGRQINPKWLGLLDYKQVFYRISLLTTFVYALVLIDKNIQIPFMPPEKNTMDWWKLILYFYDHVQYDVTALLSAAMLFIYAADSIIFEHHLASSFELQAEGFGCLLLLRYAATPCLLSSVSMYFYENRSPLICVFAAYVPLSLFVFGMSLKRLSNAVKYKYRVQPNHPLFLGIETIHTFQGRRLLLGSLWGAVRQPNYLGDILALFAMGLPLTINFAWPPAVCLILIVVLLVHRCLRANARNSARYHSSWVRYRSVVRNYLIPKVF